MTLNATNMSVLLNNLTIGAEYMTRVAAFTKAGLGPYSDVAPLVMDPSILHTLTPRSRPTNDTSSVVRETWFAVLMGAMALLLAAGFVGMVYMKRRQTAGKELGHLKGLSKTIFYSSPDALSSCFPDVGVYYSFFNFIFFSSSRGECQ